MLLSEEIKNMRRKLLFTQDEFAKAIKVSSITVSRWETGRGKPNMGAMKRIKTLCENKDYPYNDIEEAWLSEKE